MASKVESRSVNIFINGQQANSTLKEMESHSRKLRNELSRLIPGTEAFKNKMQELKSVNKQLNSIKDDIRGVGGAFGWLKTEIGKFGVLAAGYLGFGFITSKFNDIISQNAKLSDSVADVMKTTGLSELAVRRLNSEFKNIDTRSSREELNGLAKVAGKLGISAEQDVLAFVRAADQISVALGEDLGGAEQAINSLGKLVDIFKLKDEFGLEQSLLNVGSAINELGAAGTANESYLVEFTSRLGGIAPAANMGIQDILGLGATLDELGQKVEMSATAVSQFIVSLAKDIPTFARIAGMSQEAFKSLLNRDGNEALIAVLKNLKSSGMGISTLAENMGMIGEEGARAVQVLGLLSNNIPLLEKRQNLANEEFAKGISLTEEFNVRNNNFAATLDKLGKKIGALTSNFTFQDLLMKLTVGLSNSVDWVNNHASAIVKWIKIITIGGAAIMTYRTYLLLANTAMFQFITTMLLGERAAVLSRTATIALAGAKALLSGNLTKAAQAMRLLNITMVANPAGAVLAGIAAITVALVLFSSKLGIAAQAQKEINDIHATSEKQIVRERLEIYNLLKTLRTETTTREAKLSAIRRLRELTGEHLKGYSDEEIAAGKATNAVNKYVSSLQSRARATAATNKIVQLEEEMIDARQNISRGWNSLSYMDKTKFQFSTGKSGKFAEAAWYQQQVQIMKEKAAMKKEIEERYSADLQTKVEVTVPDALVTPFSVPTKDEETAAEKARRKLQDLRDDISKWENKAEAGGEGMDKELVDIENKYKEFLARAKGHQEEINQVTETYTTLKLQREKEIDEKFDKDSRARALSQLKAAFDEEDLLRTQRLQERLIQIDESDKTELEKGAAKAAIMQEYDQEVFDSKQLTLTAEALLIAAHLELADLELSEREQLAQRQMDLEKQIADNAIENQSRIWERTNELNNLRKDGERQLQAAIYSAYQEGFALIGGLFKENSMMAKTFFVLEKIAAGAKIVIALQQQLAAIRLSAWLNPLFAVDPTGAARMAYIATHSTIAKISAGVGLATVAAQTIAGFEDGGYSAVDYSAPNGYVRRPTLFANSTSGRPFIAGEKYKTEYIISSQQLKDPVIADFVGMMEGRRGVSRFEQGGYSSNSSFKSAKVEDPTTQQMLHLMSEMVNAQNRANNKKVVLNYKDLEKLEEDIATINYATDS